MATSADMGLLLLVTAYMRRLQNTVRETQTSSTETTTKLTAKYRKYHNLHNILERNEDLTSIEQLELSITNLLSARGLTYSRLVVQISGFELLQTGRKAGFRNATLRR